MPTAPLPRPPRFNARDFPPLHASPIDHLARYREAFRARGWRVLPGLLPRYHTLVRRLAEHAAPSLAASTDAPDPAPDALPLAGPEADRALTAVHPEAPIAVTVVVVEARTQPLYDVWWDGIPAQHADDGAITDAHAADIVGAVRAAAAHH